uniref:Uncharacterized protein n=1 Tax=Oryza sativa subsp. japonica TaxID=39947 RepID=Q6YUK3_ORYSJ|nr:hypothetical protein [Oryza sativa Japonica Group]BAD29656.1 hypothetical protein [Oryza sativa Japonica Group]
MRQSAARPAMQAVRLGDSGSGGSGRLESAASVEGGGARGDSASEAGRGNGADAGVWHDAAKPLVAVARNDGGGSGCGDWLEGRRRAAAGDVCSQAEAIRGHNRGPPNASLPALTWSLCHCRCPYWPPIARVSTCVEVRPPTGSVQSRVKSSAELEEEMLANIPKFRARPFNKKEFHLKTMVRATRHADTCSRKLLQWGLSGARAGEKFNPLPALPWSLRRCRCPYWPPIARVSTCVVVSESYATCRHMFSEASSVGTVRGEKFS